MKLKNILLSVFFPERCSICGRIKPFLKSYCPVCGVDDISLSTSTCQECGHESCVCDSNLTAKLTNFTAVYRYDKQVRRSLLRFKFFGESSYAEIFGKAMADRVKAVYGDVKLDGICFVPITKITRTHRGYNQSELLALNVADELKLPVVPCLKKTRATENQKDLSASQRLENVKDCFGISPKTDIAGKTLLLCDDIKTTGATLAECRKVLLSAGAKDVYCICLALTPYHEHNHIPQV